MTNCTYGTTEPLGHYVSFFCRTSGSDSFAPRSLGHTNAVSYYCTFGDVLYGHNTNGGHPSRGHSSGTSQSHPEANYDTSDIDFRIQFAHAKNPFYSHFEDHDGLVVYLKRTGVPSFPHFDP
jgi:hypothetical protein